MAVWKNTSFSSNTVTGNHNTKCTNHHVFVSANICTASVVELKRSCYYENKALTEIKLRNRTYLLIDSCVNCNVRYVCVVNYLQHLSGLMYYLHMLFELIGS